MQTILIIDDSRTDVTVLSRMLDKNGYKVLSAPTGEQGVWLAESKQPDLILMDIVMRGGMDGYQATRKICSNPKTSNIPVLMVSMKDQESDRIWGIRQGAKDFITKPVKENRLIEKVEENLRIGSPR